MLARKINVVACFFGLATLLSGPSFIPIVETSPQSFLVKAPKLTISPTTVPNGQYGSGYKNQTLKVNGGRGSFSFFVSGGSLPPGMSLSVEGVLSGTPTAAGTFSFTVNAEGLSGHDESRSGSRDYTLVILQAPLSVTADNITIRYGDAVPALTATT